MGLDIFTSAPTGAHFTFQIGEFLHVLYFSLSHPDRFHLPCVDPYSFGLICIDEESHSPCCGLQLVGFASGNPEEGGTACGYRLRNRDLPGG